MSSGIARETEPAAGSPSPYPGVARETTGTPAAHSDCGQNHAPAPQTGADRPTPTPSLAARAALAPLRLYRRRLSPLLGARCRYYPSCSSYAEQAVTELGLARGFVVAFWRLLRCNPFSPGGLDPLESRRLFRSEGAGADAERREVPV